MAGSLPRKELTPFPSRASARAQDASQPTTTPRHYAHLIESTQPPGHGSRFVRKDGKLLAFLNGKCMSLYHQKIKAQRLTWTQDWRRLNRKGRVESHQKKGRKRVARTMKPITGISLAEITAKQSEAKAFRAASRDASARAVKARKAKAKTADAKKADKKEKKARKLAAPRSFQKVPKLRRNLVKPTSA